MRLRAYEAGKVDYIADNTDTVSNEEPAIESDVTDIIIFDLSLPADTGAMDNDPMSAEEYSQISEQNRTVYMSDTSRETSGQSDMQTSDLPAKQTIDRLIGDNNMRPAAPISEAPIFIDREMIEPMPIEIMPYSEPKARVKTGGKTVTLSGETTVHIAPDGTVTITNNGKAVVPLAMNAEDTGKASAMIMDGGAPAKVSVHKSIRTENGKRKIRVEVDMEADIID